MPVSPPWPAAHFNPRCERCPRLVAFLRAGKRAHPDYHCAPVPPFGDGHARLLIVGLAPGFHGANATGRPFTGDYAGTLLYDTLYRFGFGTAPESRSASDDLRLIDARLSNAVKCVPPENKPTTAEIKLCSSYISAELQSLSPASVIVALGTIAHGAVLRAFGLKLAQYRFGHAAEHLLPSGQVLLDSYHCSRYNTNTGRLTTPMFHQVFARARALLPV